MHLLIVVPQFGVVGCILLFVLQRQGAPVFMYPQLRATARSAMVVSSVSPDLWLVTTA